MTADATPAPPLPRVAYSVEELAAMIGRKPRAIRYLIATGKIPGKRLGRDILVPAEWLASITSWEPDSGEVA